MNSYSKRTTRMFESGDFLILSCLLLSVQSVTGQISPPQNVSVLWISDFELQLSWAPPQHSVENCSYDVSSETSKEYSKETDEIQTPPWKIPYIVMEGGVLKLSVETVCGDKHSKQIPNIIVYPELVKNLECYIKSSNQSHCSWLPSSNAPDLRFFYWLTDEDLTVSQHSSPSISLQECSSYNYTGGNRTGCDLRAAFTQAIHILFNGTVNHIPARNTFKKLFKDDVRPSPLNWTVTKTGDKFLISWIPPDIPNLSYWKFIINYTECSTAKRKPVSDTTSIFLDTVSHCPYRMAIKAEGEAGQTPWSDAKYFDAEPKTLVNAVFIIPVVFAGLAALTFVCCRKNKENIFPKVPEPRDLLSDISDNNNKITVCNLYIPPEEEDNCKITLVKDPQSNLICKD